MRFSRQEYWSGLPFPTPGDLPDSGVKPKSLMSSALVGRFFTASATWDSLKRNYSDWRRGLEVGWPSSQFPSIFLHLGWNYRSCYWTRVQLLITWKSTLERQVLVERKVCFTLEAGNWGRRRTCVQRPTTLLLIRGQELSKGSFRGVYMGGGGATCRVANQVQ